ncbi:antibiotic biosynthesis monooxygenase [Herbiconiux sp. VKM Ac-2851]|uniref:antibiotic biosynthesis monooxygenase n=1 Tax=Herbiconiux sp. VKM Ac-2851 TaxID=2739025 RepID=UPI0015676338|nr:antibiotic biosynthesis monooxygenase [Herbiconiux sp. VKM Ac-2851]NQX34373.1 antibiotic biosynthesis monooxygenase [Herbiconiux sp. VKM Ac-2851]
MTETAVPGDTTTAADGTVTLVVHRRLAEKDYPAYEAWQKKVAESVSRWPGFLERELIRPNPPLQVDWVTVQHFRDAGSARGWLQSAERKNLVDEIGDRFIGNDDVHLFTEEAKHPSEAASVLISSRVAPEDEARFLEWQREISAIESRFEGFLGHKVERPVAGVQDDWVVVLSFDSEPHLNAWLDSPERAALLEEGAAYNEQLKLTRSSYGFGFWSGRSSPDALPDPVFKSNLLVLLMLYPIVFLWGYFIADPLFDSHGVPFWLSLFIGNLVSTQLLGWFFVPWAFKLFGWWVKRGIPVKTHVLGYSIVVLVYAVSMALYAWLITLRPAN